MKLKTRGRNVTVVRNRRKRSVPWGTPILMRNAPEEGATFGTLAGWACRVCLVHGGLEQDELGGVLFPDFDSCVAHIRGTHS